MAGEAHAIIGPRKKYGPIAGATILKRQWKVMSGKAIQVAVQAAGTARENSRIDEGDDHVDLRPLCCLTKKHLLNQSWGNFPVASRSPVSYLI
jgi:hypothetical protein